MEFDHLLCVDIAFGVVDSENNLQIDIHALKLHVAKAVNEILVLNLEIVDFLNVKSCQCRNLRPELV